MNWFVLILILKLLTTTWSAPIDIEETKSDLAKFIKDFTVTHNAESLLQPAENTYSTQNESLKDEFQKVNDEVKNVSTKVQQEFEEKPAEAITEQTTEKNAEAIVQIFKSVESVTENLTENPTVAELNSNNENTSNISEQTSQSSVALNELPENAHLEAVTESNSDFKTESSTEIPLTGLTENEKSKQEFVLSTTGFPREVQNVFATATDQAAKHYAPDSSEITTKDPTVNDFIISNNSDVSSNGSVNIGTTAAISKETSSASSKLGTNTATEINNNLAVRASEEVTVQIYPSTLIFEHSTLDNQVESTQTSAEHDTSSKSYSEIFANEPTPAQINPSTAAANENFSHKPTEEDFKQSIDTFAPQLEDIGSGIGKTTAGLVNLAEESVTTISRNQEPDETIGESTEFSPNYPHISNDNFVEATEPMDTKPKHNPSFKEAVDSFIADVMGIGSSLGLLNKTEKTEHVQPTSEGSTNDDQQSSSPAAKATESQSYLPESLEDRNAKNTDIFSSTQENTSNATPITGNSSETSSDSSNLGNTLEHLVGSASEFVGTNIGKTVVNILSDNENINEKEQEDVTEQQTDAKSHFNAESPNYSSSTVTENSRELSTAVPYGNMASAANTDGNFFEVNQEVEGTSAKKELILATQISEEAEKISHIPENIENTSSNQELTSTSESLHEVQNAENKPELSAADQSYLESENKSSNQEMTSTSQSLHEVQNVENKPELSAADQSYLESENKSSNQELTSTSQSLHEVKNVENKPELSAAGQSYLENENTSSNPELTSTSKSIHQVQNVANKPVLIPADQSYLESENSSSSQELTSTGQSIQEVQNIANEPELSTTDQSYLESANTSSNLELTSTSESLQEVQNLENKPELSAADQSYLESESTSSNQELTSTSQSQQEAKNFANERELSAADQSYLENENTFSNQELTSTSGSLQEVQNVENKPELSAADQSYLESENTSSNQELTAASQNISTNPTPREVDNIFINQQLMATNQEGRDVDSFAKRPALFSTNHDSQSNLDLRNSKSEILEHPVHHEEYTTVTIATGQEEEESSTKENHVQNIESRKLEDDPTNASLYPNTEEVLGQTQHNLELKNPESSTLAQSAHYEEFIPVAIVTSPEEEEGRRANFNLFENTQPEVSETSTHFSQQTEESFQSHQNYPVTENPTSAAQTESTETNKKDDSSATVFTSMEHNENSKPDIVSKDSTNTEALAEEASQNTYNFKEETSNAFNKFKNTLKSIIENETLKTEESHATNLELSQIETTTSTPAQHSSIIKTSLAADDETTVLPKKFEEELQMAVKALEQTTHKQFEEFQNNLKEAFKKFTKFGVTEHEKSEEESTALKITTESAETVEKTTFTKAVEETTAATINILLEDSVKITEPRSGAIHQQFVDVFDENPSTTQIPKETEEDLEDKRSITELPVIKHEAVILGNNVENETAEEHTTELAVGLTTLLPAAERILDTQNQESEETTKPTDIKEDLSVGGEESTAKPKESSTEFIDETTFSSSAPLIAVSLQENASHNGHNELKETNSEVAVTTTVHQQQQLNLQQINKTAEQESVKENHTEVTYADQPMATVEEDMITTPSSETITPQVMVKFIEHTETTTEHILQQQQQQYNQHDNTLPTSQTQLPLTQASFMEEQQQQIESTTANLAQTAITSDKQNESLIQTTTTIEDTTNGEFNTTTTINRLQEEGEATTTAMPELESASVEAEARSLSLPPPKLEYLQNEDGVEVFYGYSIVRRN